MTRERTRQNREAAVGVDEALARILAHFAPLPVEHLPLLDAVGLAAAADVPAEGAVPPFRNSAMDGYAVRSADTARAPLTLRVAGHVVAGHAANQRLAAGESVRIMTGAPVPDDADAVVRFEDVRECERQIELSRPVRPGDNVRLAGEDIPAGAVVVLEGYELTAARIGALAASGVSRVAVRRWPRVAILSTGDEVTEPGEPLAAGMIWNSNSPMLAALVRQAGGEPLLLGVARDTDLDIRERLASADAPDLFVTSGGVSVGDYDMVKDVLRTEGSIDIWQVGMKPGRPLAFGTIGSTPLLGLPGNPAAAFVSFLQFGWPAIRRMLGFATVGLPEFDARLAVGLMNRGGRRNFVRGVAKVEDATFVVRPAGGQGSAMLSGLVEANCLIVLSEEREAFEAGEVVRIQLLPGAQPRV